MAEPASILYSQSESVIVVARISTDKEYSELLSKTQDVHEKDTTWIGPVGNHFVLVKMLGNYGIRANRFDCALKALELINEYREEHGLNPLRMSRM